MSHPAPEAGCARSGLDELRTVLSTANPVERQRRLWLLLETHRAAAAVHLAHIAGPLTAALRRAPDPDAAIHARRWHAADLLAALMRGLANAPITLTALAAGSPSPVHGRERRTLQHPVARAMVRMDVPVDDLTGRKLTYAAVDAFRAAFLQSETS